jgi:hypothetical protein
MNVWSTSLVLAAVVTISGCVQLGDSDKGGDDGGTATCGARKISAPKWSSLCQTWLDRNCCSQQTVCNADPGCAQLLACVNSCAQSSPDTCSSTCKGQALTDAIGRYDAIGTCTSAVGDGDGGVSATLPAGCVWP